MSLFKRDAWQYKVENAVECPYCSNKSISVKHKEIRYLGQNAMGVKKHKMKAYCVCNKCKATGTPIYYVGYSGATAISYNEEYLPVYACGDKAIKAWNTRTPMERIVERLEEELKLADEEKRRCVAENMLQFDEAKGYARGIANAIEIVKEEGGLNE